MDICVPPQGRSLMSVDEVKDRRVLSYSKEPVAIRCSDWHCLGCPQLEKNLACNLFLAQTNYVTNQPGIPYRLSICIAQEFNDGY